MSSQIEALQRKIDEIKNGVEYRTLVIKHRGPTEDARLRELNQRVAAFEVQIREIQGPEATARALEALQRSSRVLGPPKSGCLKAKPAGQATISQNGNRLPIAKPPPPAPPPGPETLGVLNTVAGPLTLAKKGTAQHPGVAVKPPPKIITLANKPRVSRAQLQGMPGAKPEEPKAPDNAISYSIINKKGRPKPKGMVKAKPRGEVVASKPTAKRSSILAPPPPGPERMVVNEPPPLVDDEYDDGRADRFNEIEEQFGNFGGFEGGDNLLNDFEDEDYSSYQEEELLFE
jgi:hypothetical protein